jgi:hypothetical protein
MLAEQEKKNRAAKTGRTHTRNLDPGPTGLPIDFIVNVLFETAAFYNLHYFFIADPDCLGGFHVDEFHIHLIVFGRCAIHLVHNGFHRAF